MKTLAAILTKVKSPLEVAIIDVPSKLKFGQVLVKIHYTTICGAQINEIEGAKGDDRFLPHLLGHEASATVLEVGEGVKTVQKNDLVVMHWRKSNGIQAEPAIYKWGSKIVNSGWVTTFQQHAVVSENRVTSIPKKFDKKLAPLFGCAVTTAVGVINNDAQVKIGESVLVVGAGGVGLNIIQAARLVNAYPVIAVDIKKNKLKTALKFGADKGIDSSIEKNTEEKIRAFVNNNGLDVAIDTTGNTRVIEMCYRLTKPQGKVILVGVPRKGDNISIYSLPLHFKKLLRGSEGGDSLPHIDIPKLIQLVDVGRLNLKGIITHQYTLSKINEAIEVVKKGEAGRVVIKIT